MKKLLIDLAFPFFEPAARQDLMDSGEVVQYKKDDIILSAGRPLTRTFFILNGFVKVCRNDSPGSQFVLFYLHGGHSFGVSLMSDDAEQLSIVSVIAAENTSILEMSFDEKDRLAKTHHSIYQYVLRTAVMHYGFYLSLINSIAFEQLDVRIEYFLGRLSKAKNKNNLKISHQEIADGLNASRESVSRLLKKMEESNKIKLGRNQIEIINLPF
jgi:CRP/FNR family transcriptional regulator, anaerobic regulatory protein